MAKRPPATRPPGNPNWKKGGQGGGPKSSALVIAARDARMVDIIIGGYIRWRKSGLGVKRAENAVLVEVLDISSTTISVWRTKAQAGEEPYKAVFAKIAEAEKGLRQGLFEELDGALREQPYRYLEKMFIDWRDESLNTEATEARAQEIANDKLVLLSQKIEEMERKNPGMGAAELLTCAIEYMAEQK